VLLCNQEVGGSISFVSTLSFYTTISYSNRSNEDIKSTRAVCRVMICFDIRLSFILNVLSVRMNKSLAAPPERKMLG
jgi:hypothetical protein